jgi:site-specific DNA recombinase
MGRLRVIGYSRVSTQEQVVEGASLDAQRARIEAWSEATDADLIGVVEDAAVSGSRPLALRPEGQRIEALLRQRDPDADAVVITRLDRLGRDAAENLGYLRRFATGKVGLVSLTDRLDLSTPQGRAMAGVASVFGQLERELIGERTAEALTRLRDEGRVYGPIPYGYERQGDLLVANHNEQQVVNQINDMRASALSYSKIADWLNAESIPAKRGGRWSPMAVRSVFRTTSQRERGDA